MRETILHTGDCGEMAVKNLPAFDLLYAVLLTVKYSYGQKVFHIQEFIDH